MSSYSDFIPDVGFGPKPVQDFGQVMQSGSETLNMDLSQYDFFTLSLYDAASGTLTINFNNIPSAANQQFAWHVQLRQGGIRTIQYNTNIEWVGGAGAPDLGSSSFDLDLLMFYKVNNGGIRGMLVDSGVMS